MMEFLKKNWANIIIAVVALTGAVLMIIPTFISKTVTFIGVSQTIGIILFLVGVAAGVCLKMFDRTKPYMKYTLLGASVLVLIFMSIGLTGFKSDKAKAEGAFGNSYAIFKSVSTDIEKGQATVQNLTALNAGILAAITGSGGALAQGSPLSATPEALQNNVLATGLITQDKITGGITLETVMTITNTAIAIANKQLPAKIDETKKNANAGAATVLFAYISMMLAFGLIPGIRGTKKVIQGCCKKDAVA